jgi:hypothetical protein
VECKKLLKRIYSRELYRFVGEIVVDYNSSLTDKDIVKGIVKHAKNKFGMSSHFTAEEESNIVVSLAKINYSLGEIDPVSKVLFFKSSNLGERAHLPT